LFNSDYSWEQINKLNIGLEMSFMKDKISFSADFFDNKSKNQIINYSLPAQTGFRDVLKNFPGVVQNTGIELQVNTTNISRRNINWITTVNFTKTINRLVDFPGLSSSSYSSRYIIDKPLNAFIGSRFLQVDPQTGLYQFLDKNGKPTLTPSSADYVYVGTTDPVFYGGIQNVLNFKGWRLTSAFEFREQKGVHPVFNTTSAVGMNLNQPVLVMERWQKPGDIKPFQKYTQTFGPARTASVAIFNSDARLTDASFIRLKNLSVSYTVPTTVLDKRKIEKISFFAEAQNLLIISKYPGADPETQSTRSLPPLKVFATGFQFTF
jgi:hypothetical protein